MLNYAVANDVEERGVIDEEEVGDDETLCGGDEEGMDAMDWSEMGGVCASDLHCISYTNELEECYEGGEMGIEGAHNERATRADSAFVYAASMYSASVYSLLSDE
jgi:hypothetical protein